MHSLSKITAIAAVCHAVNAAYCASLGDMSQSSWAEAAKWQQESAILGVQFVIDNPNAPPSAQHESWMKDKAEEGWVYGETKDATAMTHPCMVPYDELPQEQRTKDSLFQAVVRQMLDLPEFCPWEAFEKASAGYLEEAQKRQHFEALALPQANPGHRWVQQRID